MKKNVSLCITALLIATIALVQSCSTPKLRKCNIDKIVDELTLEEKVHLLLGTSPNGVDDEGVLQIIGETKLMVPGAAGTTYPIKGLGIPAIVLADGPAGIRINPTRDSDTATYYCTAFPIGSLLASTWAPSIVEEMGRTLGEEMIDYGIDVILGPGMNIMRNPLCGRNFEYYSEDPLLSGRIAAGYVRGVQSKGVSACIKHFVANNQELNRLCNDSRVSERALREIYLKGFEIAVKESQPSTLMTSYNYLNGTQTSENETLVNGILRGEWGFKGVVFTDWGAGFDCPAQILSGHDQIQPGSAARYDSVLTAVQTGRIPLSVIDRGVKNVLKLITSSPRWSYHGNDSSFIRNHPDLSAHAAVERKTASEGIVLLRNEGKSLPLAEGSRVALFGTGSYRTITTGTGAGYVFSAYHTTIAEGLSDRGFILDTLVISTYKHHLDAEDARLEKFNSRRNWWHGPIQPEEMSMPYTLLEQTAAQNDAAVITISRRGSEGSDRDVVEDFNLKENECLLISSVSEAFRAAGKPVTVVLNIGGVIETASWKDNADAIVLAWLGGQECGNAVADVISGAINPSGRLPMTFPLSYEDVPSQNFPVVYLYDPYGEKNFSFYRYTTEKVNEVENIDFTNYTEGINVGYRYYYTSGVNVSYPFGYGLSYSTFEYSNPKIAQKGDSWTIKCDVTNTGTIRGKTVVQAYISAPGDRPARELKSFAKTRIIEPGETISVELPKVNLYDIAYFNEEANAWEVTGGDYIFSLAADVLDPGLQTKIVVEGKKFAPLKTSLRPVGELFLSADKSEK